MHKLTPVSPSLSRNAELAGLFDGQIPKPVKTGTTIAGVVFKASTHTCVHLHLP